jgi:hypothetical protein
MNDEYLSLFDNLGLERPHTFRINSMIRNTPCSEEYDILNFSRGVGHTTEALVRAIHCATNESANCAFVAYNTVLARQACRAAAQMLVKLDIDFYPSDFDIELEHNGRHIFFMSAEGYFNPIHSSKIGKDIRNFILDIN